MALLHPSIQLTAGKLCELRGCTYMPMYPYVAGVGIDDMVALLGLVDAGQVKLGDVIEALTALPATIQ